MSARVRVIPARERATATMERWAKRGLRERPPGSNVVPELVALAHGLDVAPRIAAMGYPWCAFAAFLAALEAGSETAVLGLRDETFNALYVPTVLAEARAARNGLRIVTVAGARRGDLALFDWSPVGDPADHLARLVRRPSDGVVATVDGNSDGRVAMRVRPLAQVRAFARDA
jgi:hypothetical protein